jgi:hypothetical protein
MHKQLFVSIILQTLFLHHPRSHGIGGDPGRADQRIDLAARGQILKLAEGDAADRVQANGQETKRPG